MEENKKINLWSRPGGTLGKIIAGVAGIGFLIILYKLLPILITLASNMITLGIMVAFIAGIGFLIADPSFRKNFGLLYFQIMRKVTGCIVEIDPVNILRRGIEEMKEKQELIKNNIDKLQGLLEGMKRKLEDLKTKFLNEQARLQQAKLHNLSDKIVLCERQIVRLKEQTTNQSGRIENSEKYLKVMKKLEQIAKFQIEDASNEFEMRKSEYEEAKAQKKAMGAFARIMDSGGMSKSLEVQLALDNITDTVNESLGQINRFLDGSNDILLNYELDNGVAATKADRILLEFEKTGFEGFGFSLSNNTPRQSEKTLLDSTGYTQYEELPGKSDNSKGKYF